MRLPTYCDWAPEVYTRSEATGIGRQENERRLNQASPKFDNISCQGERTLTVPKILGRLLCLLGIHDFRILEVTYGFAPGSNVQRLQCRRCGRTTTRSA